MDWMVDMDMMIDGLDGSLKDLTIRAPTVRISKHDAFIVAFIAMMLQSAVFMVLILNCCCRCCLYKTKMMMEGREGNMEISSN